MTGQEKLMDVQIDHRELRILCDAAITNPYLTDEARSLVKEIAHHMVWDDIGALIAQPPTCEELLRIADEMSGRDMMRFAR